MCFDYHILIKIMFIEPRKEISFNIDAYIKIESIVIKMQDPRKGIQLTTSQNQRFRKKENATFSVFNYLNWIEKYFQINDETEIRHLASLFILFGYIVPVDFDENNFDVIRKVDCHFYRFQTQFFWLTNYSNVSCFDYVVYLCKRTMQNKMRQNLSNNEAENLAFLQKLYENQWEFVYMQAQAQVKISKKRNHFNRKVLEDQERFFWFIHSNDLISKLACNSDIYLYKSNPSFESYQNQILLQKIKLERKLYIVAKTTESHYKYHKYLLPYDHFCGKQNQISNINQTNMNVNSSNSSRSTSPGQIVQPNEIQQVHEETNFNTNLNVNTIWNLSSNLNMNPWLKQAFDYIETWDQYENSVNALTAERVNKWSLSLRELLKDPLGYNNFLHFLDKEYSSENLRFLNAIKHLKEISQREIEEKSWEIWNEFLSNKANYPINIDSKSYELTKNSLKNPTRWCFDVAANHVYSLMKNDSYYRFLRSSSYNNLIKKPNTNMAFSNDNISKLSV